QDSVAGGGCHWPGPVDCAAFLPGTWTFDFGTPGRSRCRAASCSSAHTCTDVCRGRRQFTHSGGFMLVRSAVRLVVAALAMLAIGAGHAAAQGQAGSISGVVRDSSGAVLPGVTVEAASPALIEK